VVKIHLHLEVLVVKDLKFETIGPIILTWTTQAQDGAQDLKSF